jgi:hypothetical protein
VIHLLEPRFLWFAGEQECATADDMDTDEQYRPGKERIAHSWRPTFRAERLGPAPCSCKIAYQCAGPKSAAAPELRVTPVPEPDVLIATEQNVEERED